MKTRGTKEERKAAQWDALRQIKNYLKQPGKVPHPFSHAAQAEAVREAKQVRDLVQSIRNSDALDDDTRRAVAARYAQALEAAWDPELIAVFKAIEQKKPWDVEPVIRFLEADPWFPQSGHAKQHLIRHLTQRDLTSTQEERLRGVVLSVIQGRERREFRSYRRLARRVDSPEFRKAIRQLEEGDWDVRRHARWMLEALGELPSANQIFATRAKQANLQKSAEQ